MAMPSTPEISTADSPTTSAMPQRPDAESRSPRTTAASGVTMSGALPRAIGYTSERSPTS